MARTTRWEMRSIAGAAAGGQLVGSQILPNLFSRMAQASRLVRFGMISPAVDISMYEFRQADTGRVRQFAYVGAGVGAGLGVGVDAGWNDISADVVRPFDFDDLNRSSGIIGQGSVGYVGGGSMSTITVFNTGGRLFTFNNAGAVDPRRGGVYVGAQAQGTLGLWWGF
ncbi:hypothetical protein [Fibrella forsythiae]|uniref:Uncharacterized protein n=1 Tax=Fibrella forsythiae TaxID=2817061 RepID=A0ABS3JKB3_9BACT|nr:hypothetical protein [Fibrella forsythiae]MBO0950452.1 hypothetical protein [Fibrella forsythiae]